MINLRATGGEKETNSQTSQQGNNVLKQQQCNDLGQSLVTWSFEEKNGTFLRLPPPLSKLHFKGLSLLSVWTEQ